MGMYVKVYVDDVYKGSRYLGDGLGSGDPGQGCTGTMAYGPGWYRVKLYSLGSINGRKIKVRDEGSGNYLTHNTYQYVGEGDHISWLGPALSGDWMRTSAYLAAARALWHNNSPIPSGTTINVWTNSSQGTKFDGSDVHISDTAFEKKFAITHEMGHAYAKYAVGGGKLLGNDCSYVAPPGETCTTGNGHSRTSKEYSDCAIGEGFAHFYAADTWNNAAGVGCGFSHAGGPPGPGDDCEGSSVHPTAYLRTVCDAPRAGMGVEWDWLRLYWDLHGNSPYASHSEIVNWFKDADPWNATNGYVKLDAAADRVGGDLDTVWRTNGLAHYNGVDFPP
jgi:hypothetical protein